MFPEVESIAFQFGQHQDSEIESVCAKLGCVCARFGVSVPNLVSLSSGWGVCEKLGNLYWVSVVIFICLPAVILGFLLIHFDLFQRCVRLTTMVVS